MAVNEKQGVYIYDGATQYALADIVDAPSEADQYTLTFGASSTDGSAFKSLAQVQTQMDNMLGVGNYIATNPGGNPAFVIEFTGIYAGTNVAQMTVSGSPYIAAPAVATVTFWADGDGSSPADFEFSIGGTSDPISGAIVIHTADGGNLTINWNDTGPLDIGGKWTVTGNFSSGFAALATDNLAGKTQPTIVSNTLKYSKAISVQVRTMAAKAGQPIRKPASAGISASCRSPFITIR